MEKLEPSYVAGDTLNGAATLNKVCQFFKKLNIELPCDSAIPLLGMYPKNTKILIQRDISTLMLLQHYLE